MKDQALRELREGPAPVTLARVLCLSLVLKITGCARCSDPAPPDSGTSDTASTATPLLPVQVPPPKEWSFSTARMPTGVAPPERCRYRAPLLFAEVPATTHFAADTRTPGLLVAADTRLDPPAVLRSGALVFADRGTVSAGAWVPWPDARSAPRLVRMPVPLPTPVPPDFVPPTAWLGAWDNPHSGGDSEVVLYRGGKATSLGRGDAYSAADLACGPSRCALLTSRLGRVAPAGATVLLLDADPSIPPRAVQIEPEGESTARPFGLASAEGPTGPTAVLSDSGQAVFYTTDGPGAPSVLARLPAENGILDAALLDDGGPVVLAHGNVVDEKGCAREGSDVHGAKLRIVRRDQPPLDIHTPGAPSLVTLRHLGAGFLALWLSPLGCGADRRVLFGLVLDGRGTPAGAPIPIADADTFSAASSGPDADVWIRAQEKLFWLRLTCAP